MFAATSPRHESATKLMLALVKSSRGAVRFCFLRAISFQRLPGVQLC
jgi:hypothetical protein